MPNAPRIKSAARRRAMKAASSTATALRAVLYLRMSMDRTGEGAGLERQEQACRALALARGWEVVAVVDDTISATTARLADRPGWQHVVRMIEAGEADLIAAWHLERVTRSMKDLESLIELAVERGVGLATATGDIDLTTDVGRMVARILAAVATAETERKAERQILANDQRVAEGKPQWIRRPFGYELDGTLREDEAAAVRKAYHDAIDGKALTTIAREWNDAGFTTSAPGSEMARPRAPRKRNYDPTGRWTNVAVRALLRSPRNMAKSTLYGEIMGDAKWSPIVDEATWRAVERKLADRERPDSSWGKLANLLSGIATCSVCDGPMGASRRGKEGESIYTCKGRPSQPDLGRGHCSIGVDFADGQIVRRLIQQMQATGRVTFRPQPPAIDPAPLVQREGEIAQLMAELVEDRTAGLIDRASLVAGTATLRAELAEIQAELAKAGTYGRAEEIDAEAAYDEFDRLDLGEQRAILRDAFEFIKVIPRGKGRRRQGEPAWQPELIRTAFTPAWS
ncbi:site-specific DNA recombinase [Micromonospora sp. A200]|uniref:recombinase family protein n=1 Tax=Micromonospora sp. A200 TaxID=2940568 RepID=UPI002473678E|nr:recombinase family protein [Micromonospora sp. A200]MDH6465950.1 site-specific DNA recombinase [Micromonospora sp. A200]